MMIGSASYMYACGEECESVVHVLWECPVYHTIRTTFMGKLKNLLGGIFEEFSALNNVEKRGLFWGVRNGTGVILRLC